MSDDLVTHEPDHFAQFMRRRQLNSRLIELLKTTKESKELKKGDLITAQSSPYDVIAMEINKAISKGWVAASDVVRILDSSEVAGRQHVLLFRGNSSWLSLLSGALRESHGITVEALSMAEFWEIPKAPFIRVLSDNQDSFLAKIVSPRSYWVINEDPVSDDRVVITKEREKERSAVIVKIDFVRNLVQFRVPIREKTPLMDTGKTVYQFVRDLLQSAAGEVGSRSFVELEPFPIADSFQAMVDNREDFILLADTPENEDFKTSMAHKGATTDAKDVRDFEGWGFKTGFARTSLRGLWQMNDEYSVLCRMYSESVKTSNAISRTIARLFFPRPCTDQEVEHVIQRISDHLSTGDRSDESPVVG
jgi:hypothetical protein